MDNKQRAEILSKAFAHDGVYAENEHYLLRRVEKKDRENYLDIYRAKDMWKTLLAYPDLDADEGLWEALWSEDVLNTIIVRKTDKHFCGFCGLQGFNRLAAPELSIEIVLDCQHQGVGTEVLPMLMNRYRDLTGTQEYISKVDPDNEPSKGLMVKIGGVPDGTAPLSSVIKETTKKRLAGLESVNQILSCEVLVYRFRLPASGS